MPKKKRLLFALLSGVAGFLFTVFIYNADVVLNLLSRVYENEITIYIAITIFYYFLFRWLHKKTGFNNLWILILTVLTPILIDASVLITNPLIVPRRFPFASIFPLLGAGLAWLHMKKQKLFFGVGIGLSVILFYVSERYILPAMWFSQFQRSSALAPKPDGIFSKRFYDVNNKPVILNDTCKGTVTMLECFFVGCLPCEQKLVALDSLRKLYASDQLHIVMICNGAATPFYTFVQYANKPALKQFTLLYDRDTLLINTFHITGFPAEVLCKKGEVKYQFSGFDRDLFDLYFTKETATINSLLHE